MEKTGFVYLWFDKKHKRFYIGSHLGREDDGYICSSSWMKSAYTRRPLDFKRRILKRGLLRSDLLEEEYRWLSKIRDEELGKRYYNIRNTKSNLWYIDEEKRLTVAQKISRSNTGQTRSKESREKMSLSQKGRIIDKEHRNKIAESLIGRGLTDDHRAKISEGLKGRVVSAETREKLRATSSKQVMSEASKKKISASKKGRKLGPRDAETRAKISAAQKERWRNRTSC